MWFEMCFFDNMSLSIYLCFYITYISISGKIMGYIFRNKVRNGSLAKSIKSHYIHEIQEINCL